MAFVASLTAFSAGRLMDTTTGLLLDIVADGIEPLEIRWAIWNNIPPATNCKGRCPSDTLRMTLTRPSNVSLGPPQIQDAFRSSGISSSRSKKGPFKSGNMLARSRHLKRFCCSAVRISGSRWIVGFSDLKMKHRFVSHGLNIDGLSTRSSPISTD